jgi:hypothetical protein
MGIVLLQAMKVDVPLEMKCKDKFLLQTTSIKDAPADANLTDLVHVLIATVLICSGHKLRRTL